MSTHVGPCNVFALLDWGSLWFSPCGGKGEGAHIWSSDQGEGTLFHPIGMWWSIHPSLYDSVWPLSGLEQFVYIIFLSASPPRGILEAWVMCWTIGHGTHPLAMSVINCCSKYCFVTNWAASWRWGFGHHQEPHKCCAFIFCAHYPTPGVDAITQWSRSINPLCP